MELIALLILATAIKSHLSVVIMIILGSVPEQQIYVLCYVITAEKNFMLRMCSVQMS